MSVELKTCNQIHHCRSEKRRHMLAATKHGCTATEEKNKLMLIHQPWCKLKRRDLPVLRCGEKPPSRDPIVICSSGAFSTDTPFNIACLHLVLFPCCTARARVTKLFLHTEAPSVSHETPRQSPIPMHSIHVKSRAHAAFTICLLTPWGTRSHKSCKGLRSALWTLAGRTASIPETGSQGTSSPQ